MISCAILTLVRISCLRNRLQPCIYFKFAFFRCLLSLSICFCISIAALYLFHICFFPSSAISFYLLSDFYCSLVFISYLLSSVVCYFFLFAQQSVTQNSWSLAISFWTNKPIDISTIVAFKKIQYENSVLFKHGVGLIFWGWLCIVLEGVIFSYFSFSVSLEVYFFPKAENKKDKKVLTYKRLLQWRNLSQDVENAKLAKLNFILSPHCNWCLIKDLSNVLVIMELQKRVLLFCLVTASHWLCQIMSQTSGSLWVIKSSRMQKKEISC